MKTKIELPINVKKIQILYVEDNAIVASDAKIFIEKKSKNKFNITIANSFVAALKELENENNNFSIVILDIRLISNSDDRSGIEIAKLLKTKFFIPFLYFSALTDDTTGAEALKWPSFFIFKPWKELLFGSKEVNQNIIENNLENVSNEYLLSKPLDFNQLYRNLEMTLARFKYITVSVNKINIIIPEIAILYIEASGNFCKVFVAPNKIYIPTISLRDLLLSHLDQNHFIQVHKSFVINMRHITEYSRRFIKIRGVTPPIPLGRTHKKKTIDQLKSYFRN